MDWQRLVIQLPLLQYTITMLHYIPKERRHNDSRKSVFITIMIILCWFSSYTNIKFVYPLQLNMTTRSLVCQLVVLLSLGMAFSNLPDHKGSVEDMETAEPEVVTLDEITALDEISDDNLSEEDDDDFGETDNEKLAEDPLAARNISPSRKRQILSEARRLANFVSRNIYVRPMNRKKERETAMRKYYQAFVHGGKSFISDADWLTAKRGERCSTCLLYELCKRSHIQWLLNINGILPL